MTLQELECAEKRMQQQWYDLITAEQRDEPLSVLEQMYDTYILLAEEYNRFSQEYEREQQPAAPTGSRAPASRRKRAPVTSGKDKNTATVIQSDRQGRPYPVRRENIA